MAKNNNNNNKIVHPSSSSWTVYEFEEDPCCDEDGANNEDATLLTDKAGKHGFREYQVDFVSSSNKSSGQEGRIAKVQETSTSASKRTTSTSTTRTAQKVFAELFLPVGYPHTVRDGYLPYQIYDSCQGLCSYLRGVLCSAAVLQAAGVGNAHATALSAALTWASRDGLAMFGGLLYSYSAAQYFDAHVKEFRLFADIINDVGFLLDMMAPWFVSASDTADTSDTTNNTSRLLWISSAAVLCKTMCGISAGATKSSITQHFAVAGNMADLNAKESTQETFVSLIGMLLGIGAAQQLQRYSSSHQEAFQVLNWTIFIILTVMHVYFNYKGVQLLRMRTLNRARAEIVLQSVVEHIVAGTTLSKDSETTKTNHLENDTTTKTRDATVPILEPNQVHESLWKSGLDIFLKRRLYLGVPLTQVLLHRDCSALFLSSLNNKDNNEKYVLAVVRKQPSGRRLQYYYEVLVSLLVGATNRDELQAFLHASAVLECLDRRAERQQQESSTSATKQEEEIISRTRTIVHHEWFAAPPDTTNNDDDVMSVLRQKGWDVDGRLYLGFSRCRSRWMPQTKMSCSSNDNKKDN